MVVNSSKRNRNKRRRKPEPIHSLATHHTIYQAGGTCLCKFWDQDVKRFKDGGITNDTKDTHKYLVIPKGNTCPVCEETFATNHEHYWTYVVSLLGEDVAEQYERLFMTTPAVKPAVEASTPPTNKDEMNIYRIRTIDKSRKLAIQRVLKGRRPVAVKQACTDMHFLLQFTWLEPKVSLSRCEPLIKGGDKGGDK